MDIATPRPQSAVPASLPPRKRCPPAHLRIDTPYTAPTEPAMLTDNPASSSTLSSTTSDTDSFIFPPPGRHRPRNMKKLSLTLPSAISSTSSLFTPLTSEPPHSAIESCGTRRRSSTISLPSTNTWSLLYRRDEDGDGSPTVPYADGPIEVLPGIWLGNEDNSRDWRGLVQRGIKSVLNVAKEVITPFDTDSLRPFMSTPDLNETLPHESTGTTYLPPHLPSGRPNMNYLKLPWSHGQADLVTNGFPEAMTFVDQALERGDSVLVHCQCGVSRSATLMIAIVMRAAATRSTRVPPEVWTLKGMQGAYSYVKEKSKWVGPNMSLIYQLLDYERSLKPGDSSPGSEASSSAAEDEEWARRRQLVEDADTEDNIDRETLDREARALDRAMEERRVARRSSVSSMCSSSSGIGMGPAWRNRYGSGRCRTGSVASIMTNGSVLSENLVEEEEEEELLRIGGGFTETSSSSAEPTEDEASLSNAGADSDSPVSGSLLSGTPKARHYTSFRLPPPSAPAYKTSFDIPPIPVSAFKTSFDVTPRANKTKSRKRPPPLVSVLPTVPPSPVTPVHIAPLGPVVRARTESRRPELPPSHLRSSRKTPSRRTHHRSTSAAPTQTLFVFPPSPTTHRTQAPPTPSTMMVTSSTTPLPFPLTQTPCVSTFRAAGEGRRRSFIGVNPLATPTTASSRVDARGWVGVW